MSIKKIALALAAGFALIFCGCSKTTKNFESGFTIELPKGWQLAGLSVTENMINNYLPGEPQENVYLYTNGFHGKLLVAIGVKNNGLPKITSDSTVKIGNTNWNESDISADTVLTKKYTTAHRNRLVTVIMSADRINANFDSVYEQANGTLHSLDIKPFGFGAGFLDGLLWLPKWIVSWFNHNIHLYMHVNNGASYIIGFVLGLLLFTIGILFIIFEH